MSAIPPSSLGSLAQAGVRANQAADERDSDQNRQVDAARNVRAAADERATSVSDADEETGVEDGSTGVGGQGRAFGDGDAEKQQEQTPSDENGIRRDEDGNVHLDIQA